MKFALRLSFLMLFMHQAFAAETTTTQIENVTSTKAEISKDDKPWSLKMGISTLDTSKSSYENEILEGKGVSLSIQREVVNKFELGMTFTNYTLKFKNPEQLDSGYLRAKSNFNIFDVFGEFTAINVDFYKGLTFKGAVNAGASYDTNFKDSPFFYGIGMIFQFDRQVGVRADLKTYLSRANTNIISLVGYF